MDNFSKSNSPLMSEDIRLIAQALGFAKREFRATGLSARNDHQKYFYAKLGDIYGAVEDALDKNNIIIWHGSQKISEHQELLHTRLIHWTSGQYLADERLLISEKPGNQGKGAANTYMRKQAVLSLCAIAAEDDDDGNEEQKHLNKSISGAGIEKIHEALRASSDPTMMFKALMQHYKVNKLSELYENDLAGALAIIKNKGIG